MKRILVVLLVLSFVVVVAGAAYASITGPLRGIHLPNRWNYGNGLTQGDRAALNHFDPGMVVVMTGHINPNTVEYLRDDFNGEIFVRWHPSGKTSSCPRQGTRSRSETGSRYYNYNWTTGDVEGWDASWVADDIIATYDVYKNWYGLTLQRWIPGNEPELEWNYSTMWQYAPEKWRDINAYYTDICLYVNERKGGRNIEMYTPSFSGYGDVGVEYYNPNGDVKRRWIDGMSGTVGLDFCSQMIDTYGNYTWHNYFWPGCAWQHRVCQFFPSWLQTRLYSWGYPSRITEAGWHPECGNDRDWWVNSTPGWSGFYEQDLEWFVKNAAGASGVAVWLLGSDDASLERHEATRRQYGGPHSPQGQLSKIRHWFYYYTKRCKGQSSYYRTTQYGRRNLALNTGAKWSSNEYTGCPNWGALDGCYGTMWNSGGFPTQWIQFALRDYQTHYNVDKIRARVAQTPDGWTTHNLKVWTGTQWLIYSKTSWTYNGQWLTWSFNPKIAVSQVHIETTSSPSWVAWWEIEVWGY